MPFIPDEPNFFADTKKPELDTQYYLATKLQSGFFTERFLETSNAWFVDQKAVEKSYSSYKIYDHKTCVTLKPNLRPFRNINWEQTVLNRKSTRPFSDRSISFSELSNVLLLSCGLKENGKWLTGAKTKEHWPRRALPSGGGMYPLEYYILSRNIDGLKSGLWHFGVFDGKLRLLRNDAAVFDTERLLNQRTLFQNPAVTVFVTAVFARTRVKYGDRALRYILLEAGGVGAHMNLISNAMGVDFCFDGGGYDDQIERLIGINGRDEGLVACFHLGHGPK